MCLSKIRTKIKIRFAFWLAKFVVKRELSELKETALEYGSQETWKEYLECNNKHYIKKRAKEILLEQMQESQKKAMMIIEEMIEEL